MRKVPWVVRGRQAAAGQILVPRVLAGKVPAEEAPVEPCPAAEVPREDVPEIRVAERKKLPGKRAAVRRVPWRVPCRAFLPLESLLTETAPEEIPEREGPARRFRPAPPPASASSERFLPLPERRPAHLERPTGQVRCCCRWSRSSPNRPYRRNRDSANSRQPPEETSSPQPREPGGLTTAGSPASPSLAQSGSATG